MEWCILYLLECRILGFSSEVRCQSEEVNISVQGILLRLSCPKIFNYHSAELAPGVKPSSSLSMDCQLDGQMMRRKIWVGCVAGPHPLSPAGTGHRSSHSDCHLAGKTLSIPTQTTFYSCHPSPTWIKPIIWYNNRYFCRSYLLVASTLEL